MVMGGGGATLDILLRARDEASATMRGVGEAGQKSANLITQHWKQATVAAGAAGAGIEALARGQQQNTQTVNRLAIATGMQTKELRDLARETSNVTFPLDQVLGLMEQGARLGIEGADALKEYANFWDTVADATGGTATKLAESASALKVVGVDVNNLSEASRALGFVQMNTTDGVEGFLQLLEMRGKTIREFGLNVDDTAALLAVMEREMGLTGRTARQTFEQALNSADGSVEDLLNTLGISEEQFSRYRAEVDASGDSLDQLAEANNATFTTMQRLTHAVREQFFAHGELIGTLANLAPALVALPVMLQGVTVATRGVSMAMMLLSANPIGLVIVGIAALIAAGVLLWKNWDTVTEKARQLATFLSETFNRIVGFVGNMVDNIDARFAPLLLLLGPLGALAVIWRFRDSFVSAFEWVRDRIMPIVDAIRGAIDAVVSAFNSLPSISDLPGAGAVGAVGGFIGGLNPFGRSTGGSVTAGTAYVVGERGPELFKPASSGTVIPNHAIGGAGNSQHFNITVNALDARGAADAVAGVLTELVRTGRMNPAVIS